MGHAGKETLPSPEEVAEKFLKRKEFLTDHANTSLLFMSFAQHFTHMFFKTEYKSPELTWGRHGIDVTNIYGQGIERENQLRSFKDGKLKSQVSGFSRLYVYIEKIPNCTTRVTV